MDKSAIEAWLEANIAAYVMSFGLQDWRIHLNIEPIQPKENGAEVGMRVRVLPEYERINITVNPYAIESEELLAEGLRHELCHALHNPFETLLLSVEHLVPAEHHQLLDHLWNEASERTVRNIEKMMDNMQAEFEAVKPKGKKR